MSAHGRWAAELSTFESHAKAWLVGVFGIPPAAVLVALHGAGVHLPTWATALLALLPIVAATSGVVFGPANKAVLPIVTAPIAVAHLDTAVSDLRADIALAAAMPPLPDVTKPAPVTPPES